MGSDALVPQVIDQAGQVLSPVKAPRLAPRKRAFCHAFASHYNKKKAVERARIGSLPGLPSTDPMEIADRLLAESGVIAYLDYLRGQGATEYRPGTAWIREQITALAGLDISDALEFGEAGPDGFIPLKQIRLDKIDGRAISGLRIRQTKEGQQIDVKFHPKTESLKMLATEAGMLGDESRAPAVVIFNYDLRGA